ncbi:MAG: rcc01693 family protein [Hoeflea sp.]|uniref:rcc01693 family protein n=1 Tax=Hoeflea sp. TaxID=1940281 RepID=UPI003EF4861A
MPERTFFPWASVLRFGLGHLRLTPDAFWRLSLPELKALLSTDALPDISSRQALDGLMALFPDTPDKPLAPTAKDPVDDR